MRESDATDATVIRVLLVEDDPDDQWLVADLFKQLGSATCRHELTVVADVTTARAALAEHRHDVGLIDIRLGAESGLDLLQSTADDRLRAPLIVLTGESDPDADHLALAAGASDFLVKSGLTAERLDRALRYTLAQRRLLRDLEESQTRYRVMFNTSAVPMWLYEPGSLRLVNANRAALSQYGYRRATFVTLCVPDLLDGDELPRFREFVANASPQTDSVNAGVWKHRRSDGSPLMVEVVSSRMNDGDSELMLVASTDVTARLQAEAALLERELTLRHVLRDVSDGLMVVDDEDGVQFVNPALCRILGRPESELVGTRANPNLVGLGGLHADIVNDFGSPVSLELRVAETRWNQRDARVVTLRNVTEAQSREARLLLLQRAMESATEGITIATGAAGDHSIIYANPAFERMSGYSAEEILGRNCRFLQGEDLDQPERAVIKKALRDATPCEVTLRNYRKDGTLFWNRLTISPVRDANGQLSHFVGIQTDVSEQKRLENERLFLTTHDRVTGLPRVDGSEARLEGLLARARTSSGRFALFFVDLDGFNTINSTLGFAMGDIALQKTGARLREAIGPGAEVMRYAGDQFLLATTAIGAEQDLLAVATDLCEQIAQPMQISPAATIFLTASIGVSAYPDNGTTVLELTRQANIATSRAKHSGRNGAFVFSNSMREALADRMALGGRMRDALANDEFLLHYQPQVSAQDGTVVGLEALVRWNSPEMGLLSPGRFVPVAEDNGMILHLGAWVLRSACRQLRAWMDAGLTGFVVSVNVSGAQMQRPTFVEDVRAVVESSGITPSMLELELTETVLMGNAERSMAQMRALKQLGVRLALDDFGIGYSSLSYLKRFQLDKLKIDQSFIADIVHDGADAALVRAMISMGHHLGMRVVAEGVETAAQLGYLRRSHCDEFQGFHFSRPVPAEQIPELLRQRFMLPASAAQGEAPRTLLLIDDEANIRRALVRLLRRDGYQIFDVATASEAFDVLAAQDVQVVLSDQRMPGLSGSEFLSQVKEMYPDTVRMVLSGYTDLNAVTDAINRGAIYKFLTKPWDDDSLRTQVLEAFRRYETLRAERP